MSELCVVPCLMKEAEKDEYKCINTLCVHSRQLSYPAVRQNDMLNSSLRSSFIAFAASDVSWSLANNHRFFLSFLLVILLKIDSSLMNLSFDVVFNSFVCLDFFFLLLRDSLLVVFIHITTQTTIHGRATDAVSV